MISLIGVKKNHGQKITDRGYSILILTLPVLAGMGFATSQVGNLEKEQESCHRFVQEFYDWYVPKELNATQHATDTPPLDLALKYRSSAFTAELARALREDLDAAKAHPGENVGLNYDPFLYTQDPEDRYVVGKVTSFAGRYWVEIHGVRSGKVQEKLAVICELTFKYGYWEFVDFHGGYKKGDWDLLRSLEELRKSRVQH